VVPLLASFTMWYPRWPGGRTCGNDGNAPAYMKNSGRYIYSSLDRCCEEHFNWEKMVCVMLGGGSVPVGDSNSPFYVNYETVSCHQSCAHGTVGANCGGYAGDWEDMYHSAEACCQGKLWWADAGTCVAKSTAGITIAGSSSGSGSSGSNSGGYVAPGVTTPGISAYWYKKNEKCVKDCGYSSGDPKCGGVATRWDDVYATLEECCSNKVWWVDISQCS